VAQKEYDRLKPVTLPDARGSSRKAAPLDARGCPENSDGVVTLSAHQLRLASATGTIILTMGDVLGSTGGDCADPVGAVRPIERWWAHSSGELILSVYPALVHQA
jgi:hypothetical protein